jgi:hypothetical protein
MLVGFDTEYGYRSWRRGGKGLHGDVTTFYPVCACLVFEDGTELRVFDRWDDLRAALEDPRHTFVVHGCHAESLFCKRVGIPFPTRFLDTLLMSVMLLHAMSHDHGDRVYSQAALARMTARYGIAHMSADDKDAIRNSILQGTHLDEFGMDRVLNYCRDDARASLQLVSRLLEDVPQTCGPHALNNLTQLFQPYALAMADTASKGLRFDRDGWGRAVEVAPRYRGRLLAQMRAEGYDHDGDGLGQHGFRRMVTRLGLLPVWPKTRTGLSTRRDDLKSFRHVPAINAASPPSCAPSSCPTRAALLSSSIILSRSRASPDI